jgi:alpha-amylase
MLYFINSSVGDGLTAAPASPKAGTFVHLFEWKWDDIAYECEEFLGPAGYKAVQVSPPNEHRVMNGVGMNDGTCLERGNAPYGGSCSDWDIPVANKKQNAWISRYQPTGYQIESRSGTREQFQSMVDRCKAVGVDIYSDMVINHMTSPGAGNTQEQIPGDAGGVAQNYGSTHYRTCTASRGCGYNLDVYKFGCDAGWNNCLYSGSDFNEDCSMGDYSNAWLVQNCPLVGLADLKTGSSWVRSKIKGYFDDLIAMGVTGFRLDAAKHIPKSDIHAIIDSINDLPNGERPIFFSEVIDMGGSEPIKAWMYSDASANKLVTNFVYGKNIQSAFTDGKVHELDAFETWTNAWSASASISSSAISSDSVVFTDNHDNQRGHGAGSYYWDGGSSSIKARVMRYKDDADQYVLGNIFMLAYPFGYPKVMSSYDWEEYIYWDNGTPKDANDWVGPPGNGDGTDTAVAAGMCGSPRSGDRSWDNRNTNGGWMCEHRQNAIANMVGFRNLVSDGDWAIHYNDYVGNNFIHFSRVAAGGWGSNGDIVKGGWVGINNNGWGQQASKSTGLTDGVYCDLFSSKFVKVSCADVANAEACEMAGTETVDACIDGHSISPLPGKIYVVKNKMVYEQDETTLATVPGKGAIILHTAAMGIPGSPPASPPAAAPATPDVAGPAPAGDSGCPSNYERTVIFVRGETSNGQDMFVRGGLDHALADCSSANCGQGKDLSNCPCSIPICHANHAKSGTDLDAEYQWQVGDNYLDWYGVESSQGSGSKGEAGGSPLMWTTDGATAAGWGMTETAAANGFGIEPLNNLGPHYWMLDVYMDCSKTKEGKFEVKSWISNGPGWEGNVAQGDSVLSSSGNHVGTCGKINFFKRSSSFVLVSDF